MHEIRSRIEADATTLQSNCEVAQLLSWKTSQTNIDCATLHVQAVLGYRA